MNRSRDLMNKFLHTAWQRPCGTCLLVLLASLAWTPCALRGEDIMPLFQPVVGDGEKQAAAPQPAPPSSHPEPPKTTPVEPAPFIKPQSRPVAPVPDSSPAAFDAAGDLQRQKDERFRELRRQLEILNQLSQPPVAGNSSERELKPSRSSEAETNSKPDDSDVEVPVPLMEQRPHPPQEREKHPHPPVASKPVEEAASMKVPPLIVEGTIDRFALATSLFGTGQTEICLDVLKHTDLTQLSREDQIWAEYLQACCHRRAGRTDLAQQSYRRILAEKDADWIGQLARWWLDELDAKARLKTDIVRLTETLTAWEAEIDTLGKQTTTRTAAAE